jgi:IMP dehydrogenase/GMP reductase
MKIQRAYSYADIVLEPNYSEIDSRSDLDTVASLPLCGQYFRVPVIPSNMKCVIDVGLAQRLDSAGMFYILHRFYDYDELFGIIHNTLSQCNIVSFSIGVNTRDRHLLYRLRNANTRINAITIDVAHGHHKLVKDMIAFIRELFGTSVYIIAGNIGTADGARDLVDWGADAVKVGLSMGKSCTTYNCTGVGTPMFSTVRSIALAVDVPIIADGQIREVGDVCKALVAGATYVMIGSEFARCKDSPAETIRECVDSFAGIYTYHKKFFGSASVENGNDSHIEGTTVLLPMKPQTYLGYIKEIADGIQSCMSYAGVTKVGLLYCKMNFSTRN